MTYYEGWYAWADEVLHPAGEMLRPAGDTPRLPGTDRESTPRSSTKVGQFASILLDGIFMQMVVAAPGFDLEAALQNARHALTHLLLGEADDRDGADSAR
jgi:hypothetical protein